MAQWRQVPETILEGVGLLWGSRRFLHLPKPVERSQGCCLTRKPTHSAQHLMCLFMPLTRALLLLNTYPGPLGV